MRFRRHSSPSQQSVLAALFDLCKRPVAPARHALGFAGDITRRCVVNGETARKVADDLDLDERQVCGAVRIFRMGKFSPERLACVVMRDWGMDDEDIAEIFGRSVRWARIVREQQDEIRQEEKMPAWMEYLDEGLQRGDPSPAEIARRAKELRGRDLVPGRREEFRPGIRCYSRSENNGAFIPVGAA